MKCNLRPGVSVYGFGVFTLEVQMVLHRYGRHCCCTGGRLLVCGLKRSQGPKFHIVRNLPSPPAVNTAVQRSGKQAWPRCTRLRCMRLTPQHLGTASCMNTAGPHECTQAHGWPGNRKAGFGLHECGLLRVFVAECLLGTSRIGSSELSI